MWALVSQNSSLSFFSLDYLLPSHFIFSIVLYFFYWMKWFNSIIEEGGKVLQASELAYFLLISSSFLHFGLWLSKVCTVKTTWYWSMLQICLTLKLVQNICTDFLYHCEWIHQSVISLELIDFSAEFCWIKCWCDWALRMLMLVS